MMKKTPEITDLLPFYLLTAGVFLLIVYQDILSNGMFLDGLIYSAVSKNLADGLGSFWNPHFTATCMPQFHEHPPLAFGIQSVFYTVLGESRYIDKLYSLATVVMVGYIMMRIWKRIGYKHGWFTIFIWIITPTVFWASYNNLLENTLTVFTSLSILFYLISQDNKTYLFIVLSGFMLSLGFLTKGFVTFFPLAFPFLLWLVYRQKSFVRMVVESTLLFFSSIIPLVLLIIISPAARLSLQTYIEHQVVGSIGNSATVASRFDIVIRLFSELAVGWLACLLILFIVLLRKSAKVLLKVDLKKAAVFALSGLTGVLPIMISMKQSGFYIIAVYPVFAIATGIVMNPLIDSLVGKINFNSRGFLIFRWLAYGMFSLGLILSFYNSKGFSRDEKMIKDTSLIIPVITDGTVININPDMNENWNLHAYFSRFKNISLDPELKNRREYLLINNKYYSDTLNLNYKKVELNTVEYQLFKRKIKEL
jgi:4-amino-4-deoxy-L-arabinose transferase-like glycosyltransferase